MEIKRKRIRKPQRYLLAFKENEKIRVAIRIDAEIKKLAIECGFSDPLKVGETILPDANLSKSAFENVEGKCIIRKDLPMERAERYWEWSWEDWGGNHHSDSTFISYNRYVREHRLPLAIELMVTENSKNEIWVVSDVFFVNDIDYEKIKLAINLFLSIFGRCTIVDEYTNPSIQYTRKCNWEILRPGVHSKREIEEHINKMVEKKAPKGKQNLYKRNIDKLQKSSPDVIALGTKGFGGYIVFNYPDKKVAVLESLMPNNATYILNENWEEVSKYTKTQVLDNNLHRDRIFHYHNWEQRLEQYIG